MLSRRHWPCFPRIPAKACSAERGLPDLLHRLASDLEVARATAPGMPDRIVVSGSSQALARGAAQLGLLVQVDAPTAILSAVPGVRDPSTWFPMAIPETPGWMVHRFSSSRLFWAVATGRDALNTRTGLFRFVMGHQYFYYLRWRGCSYRVPVQVGKYAVMRKRRGLLDLRHVVAGRSPYLRCAGRRSSLKEPLLFAPAFSRRSIQPHAV